ncbi:MAG: histidine--tRNA ligase [Acidimicrobiales bacterium]
MSSKSQPWRAPTGTHDVLWPESARWESLLERFSDHVRRAGYKPVTTPTFEYAEVFRRGIGDESEIVGKEMYSFEDRDGKLLALRPEGTAPVVRAYLQHKPITPWKVWYTTPMFRHERPQAGRYREHRQMGVEAIGSGDPDLDAETVWLADSFFRSIGLTRFVLSLNSMGDENCRPGYIERLRGFLVERSELLCAYHGARIQSNPLRALDCKTEECIEVTSDAPRLIDHLCDDCGGHFETVKERLATLGVSYELDTRLVRGFDYYTRTTFEFASLAIDAAQNGIGGGGRYDRLAEMLGGDPVCGIGFGLGVERTLIACDAEEAFALPENDLDVFVVDATGGELATVLVTRVRDAHMSADRAFDNRSMKAQMKVADRSGAKVALIVTDELSENEVILKPLRTGSSQRTISVDEIVPQLVEELADSGVGVGPSKIAQRQDARAREVQDT